MAREPGPCQIAGQQQASKAVSQAVRTEGQRRVTPGQGMLTLQEDEVDWGNEDSDPALQHALAVIQAKGDRIIILIIIITTTTTTKITTTTIIIIIIIIIVMSLSSS